MKIFAHAQSRYGTARFPGVDQSYIKLIYKLFLVCVLPRLDVIWILREEDEEGTGEGSVCTSSFVWCF